MLYGPFGTGVAYLTVMNPPGPRAGWKKTMQSPTQIQLSLLGSPKSAEQPASLVKPGKQGAAEFDHYLDREINQPHLDRATRKERPQTETRSTDRSERLSENNTRTRETRDTGDADLRVARPEAAARKSGGQQETQPEIAAAKTQRPEEHKPLGTGEPQPTPEEKLVKALQDLNVDQERIDAILSTIKQGPQAEKVIDALAGLLTQLADLEQLAQSVGQNAGKGENALKTLVSLFNQPNSPTDDAAKLGETQQKLLNVLQEAGLTKDEAQKLLAAARQGKLSKNLNELKAQIARSTEEPNPVKEGPKTSLENKSLNSLLGGRLQTANAVQGQDGVQSAATQLAANPLLAKAPGVSLQFVSAGTNPNALNGQPVADSAASQPVGGVNEASSRAPEAARANPPQNLTPRGLVEKPVAQQIIDKFSIRGAGHQKEIFIKLEPPSLGTVRMNVSTAGETVKTTLVAENHVVKQTIESNLSQLKDALGNQGIKVDSFTVLVGGNPGQPMPHQRHEGQSQARFFGSQHNNGLGLNLMPDDAGTLPPSRFMYPSQSISLFA